MSGQLLVRSLFPGPIDIVADVHGEMDALHALLHHLGYRDGLHPEGRRLVFLGDLTDRGPDSPAVLALVESFLARGLAQCVMGNHELNILLGKERHGNSWFYGKCEVLDRSGQVVIQQLANDDLRRRTLELFGSLPLVLEREDLRVVHAAWHHNSVEEVRNQSDAVAVFHHFERAINEKLDRLPITDEVERNLVLQNDNPVKRLTSGPEERVATPFYAGGKMRHEGRVAWWNSYGEDVWCVIGHHWRISLPGEEGEKLFDPAHPFAPLGNGRVMCIDYSVGKRWRERLDGRSEGNFKTFLAALRWPEKILYLDDGRTIPLTDCHGSGM